MDAIIVTSVTRRIIAAMGHWGTGPHSNPNCLLFSGHFRAAQTRTLDMWLPIQKEYTGLQLCHCLLHEFHNIFVCHPKTIFS